MEYIWLKVLALVLIVEGVGPFLFPQQWSSFIQKLAMSKPNELRVTGFVLLAIGTVILLAIA